MPNTYPLLGLGSTPGFGGFSTTGTPAYGSGGPTYYASGSPDSDPYGDWFNSPVGQAWNRSQEAAAAQARKEADARMENAKRALDYQVMQLRQQGRISEAEIRLKEGDQQIARERLAAETRINQQRLALDTELGRGRLALDQQNAGLERAKAFTQYAQGPDTMFMLGDFTDAMTRIGQGFSPGVYGGGATPRSRTWAQFEALAAPSGSGYTPPAGAVEAGGGAATDQQGPDQRLKAAEATLKAATMHDGDGLNESSQAALSAVENILRMRKPGVAQQIASRPGLQAGFNAAVSKLGYYAPDVQAELKRWNPGQGAVNAA